MWAVENGTSVVICNGTKHTRNNIRKVIAGERIGTFFSLDTLENFGQPVEVLAPNGKFMFRNNFVGPYFQFLCYD